MSFLRPELVAVLTGQPSNSTPPPQPSAPSAPPPPVPAGCAVISFRDRDMVMPRSWLKANTYDDAMKAFKAHFGRLPQNRDVLEPEGNYDEWQGQVYLKLQLRGAPRVSPGAAPASPVLYDFSATGVGWPEILEDVEKIHLTVM